MTHVSRNPIKRDVYFQIVDALYWLLADVKKPQEMKQFLDDFFTKTEKLMLAKRLALTGMILEGYDDEIIKKVLKISTATIYRMRELLEKSGEGIKVTIKRLVAKESFEQFLEDLFRPGPDSGVHPLRNS